MLTTPRPATEPAKATVPAAAARTGITGSGGQVHAAVARAVLVVGRSEARGRPRAARSAAIPAGLGSRG